MFFKDDFYLFNQVIFHSPLEWLSPFLPKAYRPLGAELYYALVHYVGFGSYWFATFISLLTFGIGLFFLYKIGKILDWQRSVIFIFLFLFATSANHLYQLVWLATYQEVLMFTLAACAFWAYLKNKVTLAFFAIVGAILAKETALVFPAFFIVWEIREHLLKQKITHAKSKLGFFCAYLVFASAYGVSRFVPMSGIAEAAEYAIHLSPRLAINNLQWYFFWALGVPVYFPDFLPRLFAPTPRFWEYLQDPNILWYLRLLMGLGIATIGAAVSYLVQNRKKTKVIFLPLALCVFGFVISLLPVLPIIHRWPVRLLVPLIFICVPMAFVVSRLPRILVYVFLLFYFCTQLLGWIVNDDLSTFALERKLSQKVEKWTSAHKSQIVQAGTVCVYDNLQTVESAWGGAQKLRTTLHNEEGLRFFLKNKAIKTTYVSGAGKESCPPNSYQVDAAEILGKS